MKKLNVSQITSIEVFINKLNYWYEYYDEVKFLGLTIIKGGYRHCPTHLNDSIYTKEQIEKDGENFCKDKEVFYYPHIIIKTSDGVKHEKFFKTKEELIKYINSNELKINNWLEFDN